MRHHARGSDIAHALKEFAPPEPLTIRSWLVEALQNLRARAYISVASADATQKDQHYLKQRFSAKQHKVRFDGSNSPSAALPTCCLSAVGPRAPTRKHRDWFAVRRQKACLTRGAQLRPHISRLCMDARRRCKCRSQLRMLWRMGVHYPDTPTRVLAVPDLQIQNVPAERILHENNFSIRHEMACLEALQTWPDFVACGSAA